VGVKLSGERKIYQIKYVVSGNVLEQYVYEKNQFKGFESRNKNGKNKNGKNKDENRVVSLSRARKKVIRAINSNSDLNKFLTLTFEKNITDLNYSHSEFKKWVKRVNYHCFHTKKSMMKYVAVIEFQERGAIHYHVLCNLPFVDVEKFQDIWGHGFIKLNKIKGNKNRFGSDECDNVGAYVTKYMTKDNDDPRLKGRKSYLMSRNLDKPIEINVGIGEKDTLQDVFGLPNPFTANVCGLSAITGIYINDYTGTVIYNQYNLKRIKMQNK